MVSGAGFINDVVEALRLGAWDYLLKPFSSLAILEHAVGNCLHRVRLERDVVRYREELEAANRDLQASLAVLRADQEAGRSAQIQLLPENEARYGGYTFSHIFIPSLYLSGDFLDYFTLSPRYVCFYIADVSGHGSSSAFITVMLKSLTRQAARRYQEQNDDLVCRPDGILGFLNKELLRTGLSKYLTMFYGVLDLQDDMLTYSVGGHYPGPVLVNGDEACFIAGEGMPVGLFEDATYTRHTLELPRTFSLFMFSDGMLELIDAADLGQKEEALLKVCAGGDLAGVRAGLCLENTVAPPDDITVLLLNRGG
jgi:serine phosphatase RsbU (regulator of sigma subunit)